MTINIYRSTDAGAPVALPATVNAIQSVLYACLVTGYGTKPGAGWTRPFNATNVSVFKQPAGTSNCFLRIDESTVPGSALMRGFETMSDIDNGAGRFPSLLQEPRGYYMGKGVVDNNPMGWTLITNGAAFWFFLKSRSNAIGAPYEYAQPLLFGDLSSYKAGDTAKCMFMAEPITTRGDNSLVNNGGDHGAYAFSQNSIDLVPTYQRVISRSYTGLSGSTMVNVHSDNAKVLAQMETGGRLVYPNLADGGIYISRGFVLENSAGSNVLRGHMPGIWFMNHPISPFLPGDTFIGTGDLTGKSFEFFRVRNGVVAIETTDTW